MGAGASADTVVRAIRTPVTLDPQPASDVPVRVLGVDDWVWRKGHTDGTIPVDLERHRVLDLLPDREPDTLVAWLVAHPGVETISRDRGGPYADGARTGAPNAMQVADRFHLVHNLVQALERACTRHHAALRDAAVTGAAQAHEARTGVAPPVAPTVDDTSLQGAAFERERQERRARRVARYEQVVALHRAGYPIQQIARTLVIDRRTVRAWLAAGRFPERAKRTTRRPRLLDRFRAEIAAYDDAGGDSAHDLAQQLPALGYRGRRVTVWRALRAGAALIPAGAVPNGSRVRVPSATSTAWLLRKPVEQQTPEERTVLAALLPARPALAEAKRLGDEFVRILREPDVAAFDAWLAAAEHSERRTFAWGIRRDEAAVRAAVTSRWSNGQVEGQVHRLKRVKRSMYGRCGFPLLRARMLHVAA
jgi:transposase